MANHEKTTMNRFPGVSLGLAFGALLVVQIVIGYEWFMSGVTKAASGDFVSGLADELKDVTKSSPHWYKSFVDGTVIPNSHLFAWLIMVGEIAIGVVFIGAAVAFLARWAQIPTGLKLSLLGLMCVAAAGAVFMAINFHLANGGNHPWLIPKDGFDETVDLDSLLPLIQVALLVVWAKVFVDLRREGATIRRAIPATRVAVPH